ncbi:MAG: ferrous iron transporter B, partial [Planctomycetota bacterium]
MNQNPTQRPDPTGTDPTKTDPTKTDPTETDPTKIEQNRVVAIVGNPNVGKTTLFNALAGVKQKTANFPGTTQEAHIAAVASDPTITLVDLPGVYGLGLDASESRVVAASLRGESPVPGLLPGRPDAIALVLDSANLRRNLALAVEAASLGIPCVVVLSMLEEARRRAIVIDDAKLSARLGCPVVRWDQTNPQEVLGACADAVVPQIKPGREPNAGPSAGSDPDTAATGVVSEPTVSDAIYAEVASAEAPAVGRSRLAHDSVTDRLDAVFTHPLIGVGVFAAVMTGLFWAIFRLATYPMDWIDAAFGRVGETVAGLLPAGAVSDLLVDGVIAGVGATVIFLPQIVFLFFLIAVLEQSGYLARAAFVIDRVLRPFGLQGHSFVPLLSGHACALPGIMAARTIPDSKDRLATILVLPFTSCTARIPVYVLLTGLLFPDSAALQSVAFMGCYARGIAAALISSFIARRSFLKGTARPMALELPGFQLPSLISAARYATERGWVFLKKAGTVILAISIVLWWLGTYPESGPAPEAAPTREAAAAALTPEDAAALNAEADILDARYAAQRSALGRIGTVLQPAFAPLGADEQLTIGILASFAAREVFVTTMAVQVAGTDDTEADGVLDRLAGADRASGEPLFDRPTSWAMLVYFVLAMQCL